MFIIRIAGSVAAVLLGVVVLSAAAQERGAVEQGRQVFKDQGCYGCHMVEKFGTPIGPDLSHVGAKHNVAYLTRWLEDPASQKPTAHMPKIELSKAEVASLAAYLASLR